MALIAAAGLWVYGVYSMSDPRPLLVGMRIDGSRVSIKAPTCPTEAVGKVEVFDGTSEKPLWEARDPKSAEGKRGALTLWAGEEFAHSTPGRQPATLPKDLDVLITDAGTEDGSGGLFDTSVIKAAQLPAGQYWTADGPMTAEAIDRQLSCGPEQ
ncbi:hypothetical protein [Streptomyces sp. NPDC093600]|uniref:hypothetical protein n=1 Tax=Streptomyces sp. NPDC093600 TaxID=3366047 RepID=UPI003802F769